jgi:hypothetical protein
MLSTATRAADRPASDADHVSKLLSQVNAEALELKKGL